MRLGPKLVLLILGVIGLAWLAFSWFEAEREVRILCSVFHPGLEREGVLETLETGEYLRYRTEVGERGGTIIVDSPYNLGSSRCVVEFEADRVRSSAYDGSAP